VQVRISIDVAATPEHLFALTQDYPRRLEWDPFLTSAELLDGATQDGVGVVARCRGRIGGVMDAQYVCYEPPRVAAIRMTGPPWFLESFAGSWRFVPLEHDSTRVEFAYTLRARPRLFAWLFTPVVSAVFRHEMHRRLAALKSFVESGKDRELCNKRSP
jgi:ribosome-associated toxin RatA of RatAB toxin-antitoxin module